MVGVDEGVVIEVRKQDKNQGFSGRGGRGGGDRGKGYCKL